MFRNSWFILLASLLVLACSHHTEMTEEEVEQKFKEYAQNNPEVDADGKITIEHICSYPNQECDEYGKPIQTNLLDEMTNREVSLVAELIWAARKKQERGRIYLAVFCQEPCIQQMEKWCGNGSTQGGAVFQTMEKIIPKLRDNLNKRMEDNHIQELFLYDIYVDSVYTISAFVDDCGTVSFSKINTDDMYENTIESVLSNREDGVALESVAYTLTDVVDSHKESCKRFGSVARSFLLFQILQGNLMYLNGEKILAGNDNMQVDSKLLTDSLSSIGHCIYDWKDSIFSTDAGNSITTNEVSFKEKREKLCPI